MATQPAHLLDILRLTPVVGREAGTSWLELFALWQASMGCAELRLPSERRPTFNKAYICFLKGSKGLFRHGDASSKTICRTSKCRQAPLAKYGLTSSIPMISGIVALLPSMAAKLHAMICCLMTGKSGPPSLTTKLKVGRFRAP